MGTKGDKASLKGADGSDEAFPPTPLRKIARLESSSELRGFPMTKNGTALGVGGPVPGGGDSLSQEDARFSGEESAKIERLLEQVGDDLALSPQTPIQDRLGSVRTVSRDLELPRAREEKTWPSERARLRSLWISVAVTIVALIVVFILLRASPGTTPLASPSPAASFPPVPVPVVAPPPPSAKSPETPPPAIEVSRELSPPVPSAVRSLPPSRVERPTERPSSTVPSSAPSAPSASTPSSPRRDGLVDPSFRPEAAE